MDFAGRLVAGFMVVIMLAIFPLQYIAGQYNENLDTHLDNHTRELADTIRDKGYIDRKMYEDYVHFLDRTGERYDISIEDIHPVTGEELSISSDINQMAAVSYNHPESKTQLLSDTNKKILTADIEESDPAVIDHKDTSGFQNLSNVSSFKTLSVSDDENNRISLFSTHSHTDDCYNGHRHSAACRKIYMEYMYNPSITTFFVYCASCNNTIMQCQYQHTTVISFTTYYRDNKLGFIREVLEGAYLDQSKIYGPLTPYIAYIDGTQQVSDTLLGYVYAAGYSETYNYYESYGLVSNVTTWGGQGMPIFNSDYSLRYDPWIGCIKCSNNSCGLTEDTTTECDRVVTSITATSPTQTIDEGDSIVTTATATYLDGHTGTVNCTASGFNPYTIGTQNVTLTYTGLINNAKTTGSLTCTTVVTVKKLKSLTSIAATPSIQTVNHLSIPSFTVTAYYSDGTSTVLPAGSYTVSGYSSSTLGAQTVTFSYTEDGITNTTTALVYNNGLTRISVSPSNLTVERYTDASSLAFILTLSYLCSSDRTITTGYTISGYSSATLGTQNVTISYTENGITKTVTASVTVTVLHKNCPVCNNTYDYTTDDMDPGCPYCKNLVKSISVNPEYLEVGQGAALPVTVRAFYGDGSYSTVNGWTSNYNPNQLGMQAVTVEYGGCTADLVVFVNEVSVLCPVCGTHYPASAGSCPSCSETVISITASPTVITVVQYAEIPLTVTAYYRNGSSKVVTDWSIDHTTSDPGTYNATVTYRSITTKVTLTVTAENEVTCPTCGNVFNPWNNPKGCPVCSSQIVGIEAYLTSGSNLVQVGSTPNISVVLIFKDTHRELVEEGYTIDDFNSEQLGEQTIKVIYHEFYTFLDIVVVDTLSSVICPSGHVYYLNEDGSDPGCPYCTVEEKIGNVLYYEVIGTVDILETVYSRGKYVFASGNLITIKLVKKEQSFLLKTQKIYPKITLLGRRRKFICGGEVIA